METSPTIPEAIVGEFKSNFVKHESFAKIVKPEICDILIPTNEHRNPWFNEENRSKAASENLKNQIMKQTKLNKTRDDNNKIVTDFIGLFKSLNNREPMESEVVDNLKEKVDVVTIKSVLDKLKTVSISINVDNDEITGLNML